MSYQRAYEANFGSSQTGLTLNAKLKDAAGAQVGATITTGFVEIGNGLYLLVVTIPDGHIGSLEIYKATDATKIVGFGIDSFDAPAKAGDAMTLTSGALDAILIESGISGSVSLVDDANNQLTSINARQALALILCGDSGALAGAAGPTTTIKPAGKPASNSRLTVGVDSTGRTSLILRVPT